MIALKVSRGGSVFFKGMPGRPIHALGDVYKVSRTLAQRVVTKRKDTELGEFGGLTWEKLG